MARGETIAGLDIGTTKTCAVVAASGPDGLEIIGIGEAPSTGMRKGVVTDLEETVRAIEAATERAERMAGVHISHVYVGVTGEHIQSTNNRGVVAVSGDEREVDRGRRASASSTRRRSSTSPPTGRSSTRCRAITRSTVKTASPIRSACRAAGSKSTRTSSPAARRSSRTCSSACTARASNRPASCSNRSRRRPRRCSSEEKHVGCVLLDIGGGTTDIAVFAGGGVIHSATIPVGGNILTNDIALGLEDDLRRSRERQAHVRFGADAPPTKPSRRFTSRRSTAAARARSRSAQLRAIVAAARARDVPAGQEPTSSNICRAIKC